MGTSGAKTIYVGQSLNDDIYHSVVIRRRGRNVRAIVDDDEPLVGESLALKRFHLHVRDSRNLPAEHLEYCFYIVPEMNHMMYYRIVMSSSNSRGRGLRVAAQLQQDVYRRGRPGGTDEAYRLGAGLHRGDAAVHPKWPGKWCPCQKFL